MNLGDIVAAMQGCPQTQGQSVYQHGISVRDHLFELIAILRGNCENQKWRLPQWVEEYREHLLSNLLPTETVANYALYRDCGKPFCRTVDAEGKQHFPDHARVSYETWVQAGGDEQTGRLILFDMDLHTLKADDVEAFCAKTTVQEAATLLLTALAELHSNARMFGGIESTSFKIKFKQLDKQGKQVCQRIFVPVTK